ncbi:MAG: cytochrome c3 family protein [Armatimonadota bacterium]|nr:cytochrome c3 family protein [Armatimonadota bacterium]MDR7470075.1 cytochrome c3 family protein [Armatimonadota bacterium]MDR7474403.1 cytochrome c3 family protein [Armatimonadota bacterium]
MKPEVAVGRRRLLAVSLVALAGTVALLTVGVGTVVAAAAGAASQEEGCLACHGAAGLTLTLPGGESLPISVDPAVLRRSTHGSALTCATCHPDHTRYPHPPLTARTLRDYRVARAQICTTCHSQEAGQFAGSIHGRALVMGFPDVPTCTSCHGAHDVVRASAPAFRNNTPQLCGTCHGDPQIMARYGLLPVYEAYTREFHGVTTALYKLTKPYSPTPAAICYDCHGVHDIKDTEDPAAPVAPRNILTTCRRCHPTAGRFFASAWTEHKTPGPGASPLVWYVQIFYRVLIPAVLGFLAVLTVLDLSRWAGDRLKGRPR